MKKSVIFFTIFTLILFFSLQCNPPGEGGGGGSDGGDSYSDPVNPSLNSNLNISNTGYSTINKISLGTYDAVSPVIIKQFSSLSLNNTISITDMPIDKLFNVWFEITVGSSNITLVIKDSTSKPVDFVLNNENFYLILAGGNPTVDYDYYVLNKDDSKKCAPVVFYLQEGSYTEIQSLILRCPTPKTYIKYCLNNNTYYSTYSSAISITETVKITAYSVDSRFILTPYLDSDKTIKNYRIIEPPVINGFDFVNNQLVNVPTVQIAYPYIDAVDNDTVSAYMITESAGIPSTDDLRWQTENPREYTFTAPVEGDYTIYAWAKDNDDLISEPFPQTVHLEYGFLSNEQRLENGEISFIDASVVGDINNDSRNDIVFFGKGGLGDEGLFKRTLGSDGNFNAPVIIREQSDTYKLCKRLVLDDYNNDGYLDIIAYYNPGTKILCFINNKNGTFAGPSEILTPGISITDMAVGDMNNDLRNDIVLSGYSDGKIHIFHKKADGTIDTTDHSYIAGQVYVNELTLGDISGDGKTDIIVTDIMDSKSSENFHVLYQTASGFSSVQQCGVGLNVVTYAVTIADIDKDGLNDVIVSSGWNTGESKINVFIQSGGTIPSLPSYSFDSLGGPADSIIYDINNDNRNDIIIYLDALYSVAVYLQTSPGIFNIERKYSHNNNCKLMFLSDVNLDGRPDIISTGVSGFILLHYNQSHLTNE